MNRRAFLAALPAIVAAPVLAPAMPAPVAAPVAAHTLAFHPAAFALVMAPMRFDVLYGVSVIAPSLACRVEA